MSLCNFPESVYKARYTGLKPCKHFLAKFAKDTRLYIRKAFTLYTFHKDARLQPSKHVQAKLAKKARL